VRPLTEYRKQTANKDGLTVWCKSCLKEYHTERRRKQGIKAKDRNKAKDGVKICTKCERILPISNFSGNSINSDGLKCWCKECCNEYARSDKGKAIKRVHRAIYRKTERGKAADEKYRNSDKGKQNERNKLMRYLQSEKGKEAVRLRDLRRRTRKAQNQGSYSPDDLKRCTAYFEGKDAYTGEPLQDSWTLDHIVPVSKGGSSYIWNLIPCNRSINSRKHNKTFSKWYTEKQPFFSQDRYAKIIKWIVSEQVRACLQDTHNIQSNSETLMYQGLSENLNTLNVSIKLIAV
jgi:hypothetical protein